jgi:hypothetical protein
MVDHRLILFTLKISGAYSNRWNKDYFILITEYLNNIVIRATRSSLSILSVEYNNPRNCDYFIALTSILRMH